MHVDKQLIAMSAACCLCLTTEEEFRTQFLNMLSGGELAQRMKSQPSRKDDKLHGVCARGSFSCDARCFCPVEDTVWVSERSGAVSVRNGRTGEAIQYIEMKEKIFGTAMLQVDDEVWIGTNDGRLLVFNAVTFALVVELSNPDAQARSDINALAFDGLYVFAAMSACRAGQWASKSKMFVRSFLRQAPVNALVLRNSVLYLGDGEGALSAWDIASGEVICTLRDSKFEITSLIAEGFTNTLWASRTDGSIDVYSFQPSVVRIETIRSGAKGKITGLVSVGGKVLAGGYDRTIFVYHAQSRKLIGSVTGDHSSFIFCMGKIFVLETSRFWSLGNGGKVNMYDGEGFFTPLRSHSEVSEEVSACYNKIQQLRMQLAHAETIVASERDRVAQRDEEIVRLRDEKNDQLSKLYALEHAVEMKEEAIGGQTSQRQKLLDDFQQISRKSGDQTLQITILEKEKMTLRGDVARLQDELNRLRSQFTDKSSQFVALEQERTALANEKQRLTSQLQLKEKDVAAAQEEMRRARDQLAAKNADVTKKESDMMTASERVAFYKAERDAAVDDAKRADEGKKRLEDTILLKEAETKQLLSQLTTANGKCLSLERELQELQRQREEDARNRQRLHDSHVLRNHEYDVLRQERDGLKQQLEFEKTQTHGARDSETKLRLQNEELRRQVETEQNNVKMLQDQYTIFQFVVNSRGELVSNIWKLYNKAVSTTRSLQDLESNIKASDPTSMDRLTLKREWKSGIVDHTRNSCAAVADLHSLTEYIVANYFSEYEKLHLGISTSKFQPDTQRPVVVGDQLLTKLRDVTLIKQYQTPSSSKVPKPLPPPYDTSFGMHHTSATVNDTVGVQSYHGATNLSNISLPH
jgi:hypothetical protein